LGENILQEIHTQKILLLRSSQYFLEVHNIVMDFNKVHYKKYNIYIKPENKMKSNKKPIYLRTDCTLGSSAMRLAEFSGLCMYVSQRGVARACDERGEGPRQAGPPQHRPLLQRLARVPSARLAGDTGPVLAQQQVRKL
jgi:hypothetical protein